MKWLVRTITVFGSSRPRESDNEYIVARPLGSELAKRGFSVRTGGYGGVMAAVSRGRTMRAIEQQVLQRDFSRLAQIGGWLRKYE